MNDFIYFRCAWCNKKFYPNHVRHQFCSSECRGKEQKEFNDRFRRQRYREKAQQSTARHEAKLLCDAIDRWKESRDEPSDIQ